MTTVLLTSSSLFTSHSLPSPGCRRHQLEKARVILSSLVHTRPFAPRTWPHVRGPNMWPIAEVLMLQWTHRKLHKHSDMAMILPMDQHHKISPPLGLPKQTWCRDLHILHMQDYTLIPPGGVVPCNCVQQPCCGMPVISAPAEVCAQAHHLNVQLHTQYSVSTRLTPTQPQQQRKLGVQ